MVTPYAPRRVTSLGVRTVRGFRLKTYAVVFGNAPVDPARFELGFALASGGIARGPRPARAGISILHQGRTGDYLVLGWWDHENELPIRVFVRGDAGWRPAQNGEGACVWDLAVVWHEREAYVKTVLAGKPVEEYIRFTLDGWV